MNDKEIKMNWKNERSILILSLLFLVFSSCIKSFIPDIEKYSELLVVDGNINDGPGPYTIKLSKSSRVQELSSFNPYSNCTVQIEDDIGNIVTLTEKEKGVYRTDSSAIQGIPGRSYKLKILTSDGELYESSSTLLLKGLKIKSIYGEIQHKADPKYFYGRDGYQFFVDPEPFPTTDNYLLWRMKSTYKFRTDYQIGCYYDNGAHPVVDRDTLRTCYNIMDVPQLYLLNTNELQQKEVEHFALNFEDNYSKALMIRYSLKVSQFTMDKEAFTYWSSIKKIVDAGGDLYTQQPFQITNNLKNITNPGKAALGYFMVAGLSEKRLFITPPPFIFRIGLCSIPQPQTNAINWFRNSPDLWPVFYTGTFAFPLYVDPECVDCRENGVLEKPNYWVD